MKVLTEVVVEKLSNTTGSIKLTPSEIRTFSRRFFSSVSDDYGKA
jgi:hypothetical protein